MKKFFLISLLLAVLQWAWADDVKYIARSWDGASVTSEERTCSSYTQITGSGDMAMSSGAWYVVSGTVNKGTITVDYNASVSLILCDGATLTCTFIVRKGATLNVYGQSGDTGILNADGREKSLAGIGGEQAHANGNGGGNIIVHGGKIIANGASKCAGIGGGNGGDGGSLTVYGGDITANGGEYGAGIGGGQNGNGADVVIYGGTVRGVGGTDAAGIGTGEETTLAPNISGGSLTVYGGTVYGYGTDWGAGIGAGQDADGATVNIYGGDVTAWAGDDAGDDSGCAFGSEKGDNHRGTLHIGDHMMVHSGQTSGSTSLFTEPERVPACFFRPYARVRPCTHQGSAFTVSGTTASDTHSLQCRYCKGYNAETHNFVNEECTVCHVHGSISTVTIYLPEKNSGGDGYTGDYTSSTETMITNSTFELPAPPAANLPAGVTFAGWLVGDPTTLGPGEGNYGVKDTEESSLHLAGSSYTVSDNVSLTARYRTLDITLVDNAQNWEVLYQNDGKTAYSVTLSGRTLYKDGKWNTLILPFDVTIAGSPLAGADVRALSSSSYDEGTKTLTLTFTDEGAITTILAGHPYIIKWDSGDNIVNPVFSSVLINPVNYTTTTDKVDFCGIYSPKNIYQSYEYKTYLYLGSNNTLHYASSSYELKSCRAYFQLKDGLTAGSGSVGVRAFNLNFGDEEADGIDRPTPDPSRDGGEKASAWFTLDGRKVSGSTLPKGMYIKNGKKVIIK